MKKYLSLALALVLCLCTAVSALADGDVTVTFSHSVMQQRNLSYSNLTGTNLLRVRTANGYALTDLNGNLLTEDHYYSLYAEKGYITGVDLLGDELNCNGAFSLDAQLIVPFQYGVLKAESPDFCLGIKLAEGTSDNFDYTNNDKTAYYVITQVDVYHMPDGKLLASLNRDQYLDCDAKGLCLDIVDRNGVVSTYDADFNLLGTKDSLYSDANVIFEASAFRKDRMYGVKDSQGNVIVEPTYASIYVNGYGYIDIQSEDKYGLMTMDGTVLIEPVWDDICSGDSLGWHDGSYVTNVTNGYAAVELDGKVGFISTITGEVTMQPKYADDLVETNGVSYSLTDMVGDILIVSADGVESTLSGYNRVAVLTGTGGYLYTTRNDDYDCGLVDWHGNVLFETEYVGFYVSGDGMKLIVNCDEKMDVYDITYPGMAAPAEEAPAVEAPAAEVPAEEPASGTSAFGSFTDIIGTVTDTAAQPADTQPDAAQSADTQPADEHPALNLLANAILLLETSPAANGDAVISLLNGAAALFADNAGAVSLVNSAVMLLQLDPAANAASVIMLIETIIGML